jgi:hypothetical protein
MIRIFLLVLVLGAVADHFMLHGRYTTAVQQIVGHILVHSR